MKKIITIPFLLLLLFCQIGYYFFYMFQQYQINDFVKHELLAKLPQSSLEVIDAKAYKEAIEWEAEDKEFYLHGQMDDVAFVKVINEKKLTYWLNASKEEELLKGLANAVKSASEKNVFNKDRHHVIKFQLAGYLALNQNPITFNELLSVKYGMYSPSLITNITVIFTPTLGLILKNKT